MAYMLTMKQPPPPGTMLAQFSSPQGGNIVGGGLQSTGESLLSQAMRSNDLRSEFGPIVGVVSQSKEPLIRNYYGIETYDRALFIDGSRMPGVLVTYPVGGGRGGANPNPSPTVGPDGKPCFGIIKDGKCYGSPTELHCPPQNPNCRPDLPPKK
jgi:hypothetical protein